MELRDALHATSPQRRLGADREMPVRVVAIHQAQERAFSHRGRHILQLLQTIEAKLPDAVEIVLPEAGPDEDVGKQRQAAFDKVREHSEAEQRGVGTNLPVVFGAQPRKALGDIDGAQVAGALVHHVGGDCRETFLAGRVGARAALNLEDARHHRHGVMLDGADIEAVGEAVPADGRKPEGRIRTDLGQPGAIRRHQQTDTGSEPARASDRWPRGTTLSTTRRSTRRYR
jgi:hypothetical protein